MRFLVAPILPFLGREQEKGGQWKEVLFEEIRMGFVGLEKKCMTYYTLLKRITLFNFHIIYINKKQEA